MNLNEIAESDLSFTLEDSVTGFGVDITLKDLNDNKYPVVLQTTDIGFFIDIQSGVGVQGRQIELNGRISTIVNLAQDIPSKDWTAAYIDTNGNEWPVVIVNVIKDRKLGIYKLILGGFNTDANSNIEN